MSFVLAARVIKPIAHCICASHVILIDGELSHIALCGSCGVLGVYLSALESMSIYKRKQVSIEQNINKGLWLVSQWQ